MTRSPDGDNSRCLLIDWDHSFGPTKYMHSHFDHDTKHHDDAAGTSDNVGAGMSTSKAVPLTAQDSLKELAIRTVGYILSAVRITAYKINILREHPHT